MVPQYSVFIVKWAKGEFHYFFVWIHICYRQISQKTHSPTTTRPLPLPALTRPFHILSSVSSNVFLHKKRRQIVTHYSFDAYIFPYVWFIIKCYGNSTFILITRSRSQSTTMKHEKLFMYYLIRIYLAACLISKWIYTMDRIGLHRVS